MNRYNIVMQWNLRAFFETEIEAETEDEAIEAALNGAPTLLEDWDVEETESPFIQFSSMVETEEDSSGS